MSCTGRKLRTAQLERGLERYRRETVPGRLGCRPDPLDIERGQRLAGFELARIVRRDSDWRSVPAGELVQRLVDYAVDRSNCGFLKRIALRAALLMIVEELLDSLESCRPEEAANFLSAY